MNSQTDWMPGLIMLAAGVSVAVVYVLLTRGKSTSPGAPAVPEGTADDLDARYQARLAQLKDHLAARHQYPAEEWEARKAALEAQAAAALKDRNDTRHEALKAQARAERQEKVAQERAATGGFFAQNPTLAGGLLGAAVVAFFAYIGFSVQRSSAPRQEGMGMTGGELPGAAAVMRPPPRDDGTLSAMAQKVRAAPEDPEVVGELALYLMRKQDFQDALPLVQRVTSLDPFNVRGRVARTVYRALEGYAPALDELERLAATYPEGYDARMFAGLLAMDQNDPGRAVKNLEAYVASAPPSEHPPMVPMIIQQLRAQMPAMP